jgi:hypothetical protein
MKTHADIKRALQTEGTRLETLALANLSSRGRLQVGQVRIISKWDTTGVYLKTEEQEGRGSFLGYDKASDWTIEGDIITHQMGMSYKVLLKTGDN